jgi:hypothetical protein
VSGNPGGKPVGAKNRLRGDFMRDLVASWETHGRACLDRLAKNDPESFVRIAAMIVGRELTIDGIEAPSWEQGAAMRERENDELHRNIRAIEERRALAARTEADAVNQPPSIELNEPARLADGQPFKLFAKDRLAD